MSRKRRFEEVTSELRDKHDFARKKKKKDLKSPHSGTAKFTPQQAEDGPSIGALKKRHRALKRLLGFVDSHPTSKMRADVRVERERELEALEHEIAMNENAAEQASTRNKMIGKYHHVRFFDRKKAMRLLKQLERQKAAQPNQQDDEALSRHIHDAQVALNYAIYYPLTKPYCSLFPKSKDSKDGSDQVTDGSERPTAQHKIQLHPPRGDLTMWDAVQKAMAADTLEQLRDGEAYAPKKPPQRRKPSGVVLATGSKKHENRDPKKAVTQVEDESDGGFFE